MKKRMQFISPFIYSDTFCHLLYLDSGVKCRTHKEKRRGRELMFTDVYSLPSTLLSTSWGFYSHLDIFIIKPEAARTGSRNKKWQGILLAFRKPF